MNFFLTRVQNISHWNNSLTWNFPLKNFVAASFDWNRRRTKLYLEIVVSTSINKWQEERLPALRKVNNNVAVSQRYLDQWSTGNIFNDFTKKFWFTISANGNLALKRGALWEYTVLPKNTTQQQQCALFAWP